MNPYLMTPNIIRESSEGTTYCPIQDELFNRQRSVEVVGEISRESSIPLSYSSDTSSTRTRKKG